ncbi:MAG: S46 family peptidase [Weeksellaceae bacterium]|nr:S46 family peptidase [Weeksellaceae bacterium]
MKKLLYTLAFVFAGVFTYADEGMWLMTFIERLKYTDWQKQGLKLTPEEIYSVNNASLKDAIVSFGGYCTGEMISDQGLLLTNHHCGYGVISELSSVENDYLENGYWAQTKNEELPAEGLYVRYLVRMDDVTDRILQKLNANMTEAQRSEAIQKESDVIQRENAEDGKYVVQVRSFFGGNEFYYFVYQDYKDVRLVGTPPNAIGKYGGDTDNWEWPRHTGDFALFRVYADASGNPAEYSASNVPYRPKHSLPVKTGGIKAGDFAMTIGYPGNTERYLPSFGIKQAVEVEYPAWIESAKIAMDAMKKHMDKNEKVRIDYASRYSQLANYWKNRIGMTEALGKLRTADKKVQYETDFQRWADANPQRKAKYGKVIQNLRDYYSGTNEWNRNRTYIVRGFLRGSQLAARPYSYGNAFDQLAERTGEQRTELQNRILADIDETYSKMHIPAERDILVDLLNGYVKHIPADQQVAEIKRIQQQYNGNFARFVDEAIATSVFTDRNRLRNAFNNNQAQEVKNDPLYKLSEALISNFRAESDQLKAQRDSYSKNYRLFIDGLRQTYPDRIFFPDANSTMRLSTGKVIGLPENPDRPSDHAENYYTTLQGGMLKYQPGDEEFHHPLELIRLYNTKDYGPYANEKGQLPVNFLTDNDITGGNSGSPVISGKGELIGLAFDGNWEAMSGDIEFEHNLQRTINVDVRYILFIIDKFAGAKHLIDEMNLVD